jgi:hypothetical protein
MKRETGMNAGPKTACGGKDRERPWEEELCGLDL